MDNKETCAMLIRYYNMQAGTAIRCNNEWNQKNMQAVLDRANGDARLIQNHIKDWIKENPTIKDKMFDCLDAFDGVKVEPEQQPQMQVVTETQAAGALGLLEQAVAQIIAKTQAEKIESEIMGSVEQKVRDFIKEEYGAIERKIVTVVDSKKVPMQGIQHEKFETVLKFVANNEPVFLTGPAGSGKNVLCKQVAEALGLKFYFTNAVTQEYKLTGFTDAMGDYQPSQFYKAFTEGGVFMLDEMDASIPEVLVILNAAIANRYFDFPAPIGYVEAHPDFRVIAAGNTVGHGADYEYVGRNQLDAASLDRFAIVKVDYSEAIENNVAQDMALADFCRDFRSSAKKAGVQVVVSYRAIERMTKMSQLLTMEEVIETCLVKGLEKDDVNMILNGLANKANKWAVSLSNVMKRM